jgi:hypothetical protein
MQWSKTNNNQCKQEDRIITPFIHLTQLNVDIHHFQWTGNDAQAHTPNYE